MYPTYEGGWVKKPHLFTVVLTLMTNQHFDFTHMHAQHTANEGNQIDTFRTYLINDHS